MEHYYIDRKLQMIEWLKSWTNQIIVAVIIATILEMIIPNGNNKKYIKVIIGLYVLFTIIQPVITKVTGNNLNFSDFKYEKYFDNTIQTNSENFEYNNSKLIEQTYIDNIKSDIKTKVKQKGYDVSSCNIEINNNSDLNSYGNIKSIAINITKKEVNIIKENNNIEINKVNININNTISEDNKEIEQKEKESLKEYLSNQYSLNKKYININ